MAATECDLLIVGGGPSGLSAAINGASEGLRVILMDSGPEFGGQARHSSCIENYPGFPDGISGSDLVGRCLRQARKFRTDMVCPQRAVSLRAEKDWRVVVTDDEQVLRAKAVILSTGLSYKRLAAPGLGEMMGRGVLYGAPTYDPSSFGECTICIVGGANSAGQAALHVSGNKKAKVKLLVRSNIKAKMSQYLIDRISTRPNIEVVEGVEVVGVEGSEKLQAIEVLNLKTQEREQIQTDHMFIFIGASPKTFWLEGGVVMDERRFIVTGSKLIERKGWNDTQRPVPLHFETSVRGVFACGDVRLGSVKRIAAAAGEGAVALQMCHEFLSQQ